MGESLAPRRSPSMESAVKAFFGAVSLAESISFDLWKNHGLTLGQVRLLRRISRQSMVAGDLAKELDIRAASLTRMMERLETGGLVERILDREDRRRILVSITATGRQVLGGLNLQTGPIFEALETMSEGERDAFTESLESFIRHVREVDAEASPETP